MERVKNDFVKCKVPERQLFHCWIDIKTHTTSYCDHAEKKQRNDDVCSNLHCLTQKSEVKK